MSFMFHSPSRTRIPDVAVLRSQPKTRVRFPFRTALRIPMLIPVYAVSSCYHPAVVDESTTTRDPPGEITGLDDRRLPPPFIFGECSSKISLAILNKWNCWDYFSFYLPWNFSEACIVTTDDSIHTSVGQSAF